MSAFALRPSWPAAISSASLNGGCSSPAALTLPVASRRTERPAWAYSCAKSKSLSMLATPALRGLTPFLSSTTIGLTVN